MQIGQLSARTAVVKSAFTLEIRRRNATQRTTVRGTVRRRTRRPARRKAGIPREQFRRNFFRRATR